MRVHNWKPPFRLYSYSCVLIGLQSYLFTWTASHRPRCLSSLCRLRFMCGGSLDWRTCSRGARPALARSRAAGQAITQRTQYK